MSEGYVYILINHSIPNLIKIGKTTRPPQERASELSSTGVPSDFIVVYYQKFEDCNITEQQVHEYFSAFRHNKDREFFEIQTKEAIDYLNSLQGKIGESINGNKNEQFIHFYYSQIDYKKYRIGVYISNNNKFSEQDREYLSKQLEIAYGLDESEFMSGVQIIDSKYICYNLLEEKFKIEKLIIEHIKIFLSNNTYWVLSKDDDDQTIVVRSTHTGYVDYGPKVLFEELKILIKEYAEKNEVDIRYKRNKISKLKTNI